jgi:tetraacyldisaccharide 4'-kinase
MSVLSAIFGTAVRARNSLYDRGLLKSHRLAGPVISVGNIRVGGAGKTPFVILLGDLLKQRGIAFDVLSRGYGRKTRGIALVDPQGVPDQFGDEPLLIARKLGVPVVVGEDRYAAGLFAERRFGAQLHLLDDGFQHRRLARDYDIVLLTPTDAVDTLLPTGRLREPLAALRRADAVVSPAGSSTQGLPLEGKLALRVRRGICASGVPARPVAFCAIARPELFFGDLRESGISPVAEIGFRDHHRYSWDDVGALRSAATEHEADGFVTTEKDAVNVDGLASSLQPLAVVPALATLEEADVALDEILATIVERRGTGHSPVPTP